MFENLNIFSSVAAYVQIENHVQFAVCAGALKAGDRLPSARELALKLKINLNTVGKSYRDLEVMGIVYTRRGMGVFISKEAEAKCKDVCLRRIRERLKDAVAGAKASGMSAQEIRNICATSYTSAGDPYAETPAAVVALAKLGTPKK